MLRRMPEKDRFHLEIVLGNSKDAHIWRVDPIDRIRARTHRHLLSRSFLHFFPQSLWLLWDCQGFRPHRYRYILQGHLRRVLFLAQ